MTLAIPLALSPNKPNLDMTLAVAVALSPNRGAGTIFFLGGGQTCWGHRHIHPLQTKSWGAIAPLAPRLPRP